MQINKRVIQLAKERALIGFSMLAQNMVAEAENSIAPSTAAIRAQANLKPFHAAQLFLRENQRAFLRQLDTFFRDYLERAMQTMYTDLRAGLHNVSADHLSLIDDETVNRQIEVGRLVVRIRDADNEHLARLNIMIAQLHGDHDVRERENPFRPYLLARSLHEVLMAMVTDEDVAKLLFEHLSNSMANHLPAYYASIREVFEANGIQTRLVARPSMLTRAQREMLARQKQPVNSSNGSAYSTAASVSAHMSSHGINLGMMSGLQSMFKSDKSNAEFTLVENDAAAQSDLNRQSSAFQDFIWQIFNQPKPVGLIQNRNGKNAGTKTAADVQRDADASIEKNDSLIDLLNRCQKLAARGQAIDDRISPDANQLLAFKSQMAAHSLSELERITVEVVALLFEFILHEEQIPKDWRSQLGRLQIPVLKAALITPDLLHQASHPARLLLNRVASIAIGFNASVPADPVLESEIMHIVSKILAQFEDDIGIFSECLDRLNQFLVQHMRHGGSDSKRLVNVVERVEKNSVVMMNMANALQGLLAPLNIDARISDFILKYWVRVLVLVQQLCEGKPQATNVNVLATQYRDLLPWLVWSVQEKSSNERTALIRLLPNLAKGLKKGLEQIELPPDELKHVLDRLMEMHAEVLRSPAMGLEQNVLSLEELHQHFSLLTIDDSCAYWMEDGPVKIAPASLQAALGQHNASVQLRVEQDAIASLSMDAEWLMQMQLGVTVELPSDTGNEIARLIWISTYRSLYIFASLKQANFLVYSSMALAKALRDGALRPLEYAPLFDRAVESLLNSAEMMKVAKNELN